MIQALELRAAGASYRQISEALSVSKTRAYRIVTAGLAELAEESKAMAARVRELELFRLEKIRFALWARRSDPRVADTLIRLSERTARLVGLDAPAKYEVTGDDGGPVQVQQTGPDLTKLTDEEIEQLAKINKKLKG